MNAVLLVIHMTFIGLPEPAADDLQRSGAITMASMEVTTMQECRSLGERLTATVSIQRFKTFDYDCISVEPDTDY